MSKLTIICQVKKGKLELDQDMFRKQLKAVPDGMYNLAIELFINNTSHQQRKYFYLNTVVTPNKVAIKAAIEAGEIVRGAEIVERQNLQIK